MGQSLLQGAESGDINFWIFYFICCIYSYFAFFMTLMGRFSIITSMSQFKSLCIVIKLRLVLLLGVEKYHLFLHNLLERKNIVFQTSAHLKLIRTYTNFRHTYPKLRCSYPKLWCQVPIDAQKFRIGAQKFSVGNLVFQHFKDKYADLLLP